MTSVDRIQGLSGGLAVKAPVRVATTANITLSGEQTIDGVAVVSGDRVLVKDQADTTANGIYDASTGAWSRALDFDGNNDIVDGSLVLVRSGTAGADLVFRCAGTNPILPGTSAITFAVAFTSATISAFMLTLLDDVDAGTARATLAARGTADDVTLAAGKVVIFEGTTADDFETTLTAGDPTADRTVTLPNADTVLAGLAVAETFTAPQRGTITTDNDGSFDQSVTNNFKCTPTGAAALTFTNHTSGQSGLVLFINGSNYAITAAATTYIAAADLVKLSATGTYLVAYLDNGTNAYCTVTAALTSAGA